MFIHASKVIILGILTILYILPFILLFQNPNKNLNRFG